MSDLGISVRQHFPLLSQTIEGNPLVYLDNAAMTQKPTAVLDAMRNFYEQSNANIKRGMHPLAEAATERYEDSRRRVQAFLGAKKSHEIIFTKNCTEAINLVARSWGEKNLRRGDVVLLSLLEHHSNIVPWLQLKEKIGIEVEWIGIDDDGTLRMEDAKKILEQGKVELVAITAVSNVLGTVTPYREIISLAHEHGALTLLDAAQLIPHESINVQDIDCDFLAFSGHKIYGPTGVGILYAKENLLEAMPPFLGGGMMIQEVTTEHFSPAHLPEKFEAGTPPIAEAVGLHAALDFVEGIGWERIRTHECELVTHALQLLENMEYVTVLGPKNPQKVAGCISFVTNAIHPHDLTEYCGRKGICLRAGHHCAQPLHDRLGKKATTRMSFGIYNTKQDIDDACNILDEAQKFFKS